MGTERARQLRSRFVSQTSNAYNSLGTRAYTNRPASSSVYTYDAVARLSQLGQHFASSASNLEQGFGYNNASQITTATRDNDAFVFDGLVAVNRNYTVNGLNQYTAVGALPAFQYDDNGNLTYDGSNSYAYDAENRLVRVTGARTANLVYDPLGRLLQVDEGTSGTTSLFLYDGDNLAAEYAGDGAAMSKRYVFGRGVDEPIAEATGSLLDCSSAKFLHADNQGSIIAQSDCSGNRTAVNTYDEWGIPGSTNSGRFQYTGQMWLSELGMYYYKARIYSPTLGRFLQTDPIGYKDQINLYAYVGNDPLNFEDPTGNFATGCGSNTNRNAEGCTSQQVYDPNDDPSKVNKSEDSKRETKEEQQNKAMSNNLSNSVVVALQKACHCKIDHRNIQPLTPNAARVVDPSKLPPIFTRSFSIHSRSAGYADIGHRYVIKLYPHDSDNRGLPTITITTSITNPYHWINVPFYEMGDPINNYNARQWCLASSAC